MDIYMPDMKYAGAAVAERLSRVPDYPELNRRISREECRAALEMARAAGLFRLDDHFRST